MNEVNFGWITGKTLTFSIYEPDGTERESGTSMTETPASSGLYLGSPTTIVAGDNVVIKEGSVIVGHGEYRSEIKNAGYLGDFKDGDTLYFLWNTVAAATAGTIKVYKDNGTAEVTIPTGITDTRDFDGQIGIHLCSINLSVNIFYEKIKDYSVIEDSIANVIATFSIENRYQGLEFEKDG